MVSEMGVGRVVLNTARRQVQAAILLYLLIFAGLNIYVWAYYAAHQHVVHEFPLGPRMERFGDLLNFTGKHQIGRDSRLTDSDHLLGTLFPRNYPPFAVAIYLFLLQICAPYAIFALLAPVFAAIAAACVLLRRRACPFKAYRWYVGAAIFATGLFGWGTLQVAMRGNIEGLIWVGVCIGAALFARRQYTRAAVAFAFTCCIKPYPVLWFALLARHRRYREALIGLATVVMVTFGSLFVIDRNPLRAYRYITVSGNEFFVRYIAAFRGVLEMRGDHSLLQTMKMMVRIARSHGFPLSLWDYDNHYNVPLALTIYKVYMPLSIVIGLIAVWRVWNKPVLNQIFALACITMVLPPIAGDYTLILILVPMGFFLIFLLQDVAEDRTRLPMGNILWFLLPCAWITATEPQWILHGVFKCIALLVLLVASVTIALPSTVFGEIGDSTDRSAMESSARGTPLTRSENEIAHAHGPRVGTDGGRSKRSGNACFHAWHKLVSLRVVWRKRRPRHLSRVDDSRS